MSNKTIKKEPDTSGSFFCAEDVHHNFYIICRFYSSVPSLEKGTNFFGFAEVLLSFNPNA